MAAFPNKHYQFSHSIMSDSLQPQGLQHARLPCPSPTPGACSNSCPLSWWCHLTISSSVIPFSSCLQSFPALGSFPMSQLFASCSQSIGVSASASVLPMNIHVWLPLGPRDPTETQPDPIFECLSVSCRGTSQQWPITGAGALGAADLDHTACGISPLGGGCH